MSDKDPDPTQRAAPPDWTTPDPDRPQPHHKADPSDADAPDPHAFAVDCARLLGDDKCENVVVLDVRGRSPVTDYVVIGSGSSDRQMKAVLEHAEELGERRGFHPWRTSRDDNTTWLLADFIEVVVHLFEPNTRAYYDLETLWGDAPRVRWRRPKEDAPYDDQHEDTETDP